MSNARSPQLRFGRGGPVDDSTAALRIAFVVACFLNPITTLITLAVILCGRTPVARRVPTWILPLTGIAACTTGWATGWCADYLRTYRDAGTQLLDALINALRINGPSAGASTPGQVLAANWQTWAIAQVPFAACLALLVAGIYLAYRRRFDATWREDKDAAGPRARTKRPASPKRVHRAKARQRAATAQAPAAGTVSDLDVPIGVDEAARPVNLDADALRTHGVVIGPTGVGKTQALERIIYGFTGAPAARELHLPAVVVDMKADPGLAATLAAIAKQTGRRFHHVTVDAGGEHVQPDCGTHGRRGGRRTVRNPVRGRQIAQHALRNPVTSPVAASVPSVHRPSRRPRRSRRRRHMDDRPCRRGRPPQH